MEWLLSSYVKQKGQLQQDIGACMKFRLVYNASLNVWRKTKQLVSINSYELTLIRRNFQEGVS